MTSKEAFDRIKEHCIGTGNSPYKAYTNSYEPMGKDLEIIEKDLEILSILKEYCLQAKNQYGEGTWGWVEFPLTRYEDTSEDDADEIEKAKIREWLCQDQ